MFGICVCQTVVVEGGVNSMLDNPNHPFHASLYFYTFFQLFTTYKMSYQIKFCEVRNANETLNSDFYYEGCMFQL